MSDVINANELRIGNYIQSRVHPVYWCVEEILTEIVKVSTDMIGVEPNNRHYASIAWDLTPIPLTEEWLLKLGFTDNGIFEKKDIAIYLNIFNKQEYFWSLENGDIRRGHWKIKHVHQLQNLYFALIGEELTISPSNQAVT